MGLVCLGAQTAHAHVKHAHAWSAQPAGTAGIDLHLMCALCCLCCIFAVEGERVGSDVGDDEDGNVEPPPEAVEAEDMLFGKKRKKSRQTDAQMSVRRLWV